MRRKRRKGKKKEGERGLRRERKGKGKKDERILV